MKARWNLLTAIDTCFFKFRQHHHVFNRLHSVFRASNFAIARLLLSGFLMHALLFGVFKHDCRQAIDKWDARFPF